MNARRIVLLLVLVAAVLVLPQTTQACPSCKAALASQQANGSDLVSGFFWSILFMMSMPFALVGSFSGYMYWQVRKARQKSPPPPLPGEQPRTPAANSEAGSAPPPDVPNG
jgi:hypothetical protein